jgi:UDP-N-acetylglucosamine--N-acetylmuramyl-(pentapeptide) pyrophosphoryl-undecaprenol N-acetylglucosamine transferase
LAATSACLHEQNSVAGAANRVLARLAQRVFCAFPGALPSGQYVGNPLRAEFLNQAAPAERFASRSGPLQVLVVGGSLGARALNTVVPQALALIPAAQRPVLLHQSGEKQMDALRANYAAAGVEARLTPFIDNTAQAYAQADLVLCRAGASTVTEIAAVGAAALFVPFPFAVDDHQTHNGHAGGPKCANPRISGRLAAALRPHAAAAARQCRQEDAKHPRSRSAGSRL